MARGLQIGKRIPLGEESTILPLAPIQDVPIISLEQEAFAETLGNVERAPEGALPQITTESFLTQEEAEFIPEVQQPELDFATQQIIAQGQQRRAEEAFARTPLFRPTVTPIQTAAVTDPVFGTTPIFTGGGVRLSIVERRNAKITEAAGKITNKPSDEELSGPFQFLRQLKKIAAKSSIDATNRAFAEAVEAGATNFQDIQNIINDPGNKIGRKVQQAISDIETLTIEAQGLNDLALEARKLSRDLGISLSRRNEKEIDDILRGASEVLEGLGKGDLGERIARTKTQTSILAVLDALRPNINADVETTELKKIIIEGISNAEIISLKTKQVLSDEKIASLISLSGQEDVIREFGVDKFAKEIRSLFEKDLVQRIIPLREATRVTIAPPPKDVTAIPASIREKLALQGLASKVIFKDNEFGVEGGAIVRNREGEVFGNGMDVVRTVIGGRERITSKKNAIALRTEGVRHNTKEQGIGNKFNLSDVETQFDKQGITRKLEGDLNAGYTKEDRDRLKKLQSSISAQQGIDNARIEDILTSNIWRGSYVFLGNDKFATTVRTHDSDGNSNAIRGFSFETSDGESGISIPTKVWNATLKNTGLILGIDFSLLREQGNFIVGKDRVWIGQGMFITDKDAKNWVIASDDGFPLLDDNGKSFSFSLKSIETPFRIEAKKIARSSQLRGVETGVIGIVPTITGGFSFSVEEEIQPVEAPQETIPTILTTEEFNRLPPGAKYRDSDGNIGQKP